MYKKSLKSMPRSIKKEVVKQCDNFFHSVDNIIPISESDYTSNEKWIVGILSDIKGLPSYWLISSKIHNDLYFIVFEKILNKDLEEKVLSYDYLRDELYDVSHSPYYGIY